MFSYTQKPLSEVHLQPGEVYCSAEPLILKTLLGSCVAVCLWDDHRKLGGMNHVMLPLCREDNQPSTRYANVATFVLYDMMRHLGCLKKNITARIFGGACALQFGTMSECLAVGARNIEISERVLQKLGIKVIGSDTGGHQGRKIFFDQRTGKIRMSYIRNYNFKTEQVVVTKGERRREIW